MKKLYYATHTYSGVNEFKGISSIETAEYQFKENGEEIFFKNIEEAQKYIEKNYIDARYIGENERRDDKIYSDEFTYHFIEI